MNRTSFVQNCVEKILELAEKNNIAKPYVALELFAGTGEIYTASLAKHCSKLYGYDINLAKKQDFLTNIPNGEFICLDVIKNLNESLLKSEEINIISIDNPLGFFGENKEYCEHFDFINQLYKLIQKKSILAFNIVKKPYNYQQNERWNIKRQSFYNKKFVELDLDYAKRFYVESLQKQGIKVFDSQIICRELDNELDYFYMFISCVDRIKK